MTAVTETLTLPIPEPLEGTRATGWWGMLALIATEGTLFVLLLFSYFYLRWDSPRWPPAGISFPEFTFIIPATILLLGSSVPIIWAESGIRRGNQSVLRRGLAIAWVMALCFIAIELFEWSRLGFGPRTNAYGSLFFTITGLHLAHVTIALLMNAYVQLRAYLGHFDSRHHLAVQNVGMYWHFVDIVWVFVFLTIYVSPHFA